MRWAWDNVPPIIFMALIFGFTCMSAYSTVEGENLCQTHCFPFAARGDCECANDQGHWIPQEIER